MKRRWAYPLVPVLLLLLGACAPALLPQLGPDDDAVLDLYLIGDAGRPNPAGEPVLEGLKQVIRARGGERAVVAFLGDNIYPEGLPDEAGPLRVEAERILWAQMEVPLSTGARGVFVAGNHGWDHSGPEGWEEIIGQEAFIEAHGRGRVELLPGRGCPGPAVKDLGDRVRLVALDTQWWLHRYEKPAPPPDLCPAVTDEGVVARLREALAGAGGREVIVVAHHPLVSGGIHGVWPILPTRFAPIPKFSPQDLGHPQYRHLRQLLVGAFADDPPLVYAAGHDHSLQIMRGEGSRYALVSGTGIYGHTSRVGRLPRTLYAKRASGFMRLSALPDGSYRLAVYVVDASGRPRVDYSMALTSGD